MSVFRENIVPVVIWYNPDCSSEKEIFLDNIKSYSYFFKNVIIVDNSSYDNQNYANLIEGAIYIPNLENVGIGKAQNIGFDKAKSLGYEWVLTMDQDSYWKKEDLEKYIETAERFLDKQIFCFGPVIKEKKVCSVTEDMKRFARKILGKDSGIKQDDSVETDKTELSLVPWLISSGNLIKISAWEDVGKFNEDYFIDNVDFEFCLKLRKKYPDSIGLLQNVQLNHCVGDVKKFFFKRTDYHFGARIYYCVRNSYYLVDEFPEMRVLLYRYKQVFKENLRDLKFKEILLMMKGWRDYKKGIVGKLK